MIITDLARLLNFSMKALIIYSVILLFSHNTFSNDDFDRDIKSNAYKYWLEYGTQKKVTDSMRTLNEQEFESNYAKIRSYYLDYLGREPDQSGINYWLLDLLMRKQNLKQIEENIKRSNEAKIRGYFLKHLLREPDQQGLDAWISDNAKDATQLETVRKEIRLNVECKFDCL